jgi:hypothetical protein
VQHARAAAQPLPVAVLPSFLAAVPLSFLAAIPLSLGQVAGTQVAVDLHVVMASTQVAQSEVMLA